MTSNAKIIRQLFFVAVAFVAAIIADEFVRNRSGGSMKIDGLPIGNANVTGAWKPDFLWMGKAWQIEVQSGVALELKLDGRSYEIPSGLHTIYSNHDHTNTGQFGTVPFWGYPERAEIRLLEPVKP